MYIMNKEKSEAGQYQGIQSWDGLTAPEGFYWWPDNLDRSRFDQYEGFVILKVARNTVVSYEPDVEAYEAWKASQPEPEPTDTEILNTLLGVTE